MARGFVHLVAVLDGFSRKVLAWRLSTTLETGPCIEALKDAMRHHGKPEIMNTDQGSQFTSIAFIKTLKDANIQISMDGKVAWRDNVFGARLWRTIKYEEVYLRAYDSVSAARECLARYLKFYNTRRPHSSPDGQTPHKAYLNPSSPIPPLSGHAPHALTGNGWRHNRAENPPTKRLETVQTKPNKSDIEHSEAHFPDQRLASSQTFHRSKAAH